MSWVLDHLASLLTFLGVIITAILGVNNKNKIQEVHLTLNSRLDALLNAVAAQGRLEGAATERARADLAEGTKSTAYAEGVVDGKADSKM